MQRRNIREKKKRALLASPASTKRALFFFSARPAFARCPEQLRTRKLHAYVRKKVCAFSLLSFPQHQQAGVTQPPKVCRRRPHRPSTTPHYIAENIRLHTPFFLPLFFSLFLGRVFSRCTDFHICVSTSSLPHPIKTKSTGFVVSSSYRGGKEEKKKKKTLPRKAWMATESLPDVSLEASMLAETKRESSAVALSKEEKSGRKEQRSL